MQEEKKSSSGCIKVFFITLGICVLLVVGGSYYLYQTMGPKVREMTASGVVEMFDNALKETPLSVSERERAMEHVNKLAEDIRDGDVGIEQGTTIALMFAKSVLPVVVLLSFENGQLIDSGLSEVEKQDGRVAISRVNHGLISGQISFEDLETRYKRFEEQGTQGAGSAEETPLRDLSDDEIRDMITSLDSLADEHGIEEREYQIDIAELIENSIAQGLNTNLRDLAETMQAEGN